MDLQMLIEMKMSLEVNLNEIRNFKAQFKGSSVYPTYLSLEQECIANILKVEELLFLAEK